MSTQDEITITAADAPVDDVTVTVTEGQSFSKRLANMASMLMSRLGLASRLGVQFGGKRKLYQVFGYPEVVSYAGVMGKYSRQDIMTRIIDSAPGATWKQQITLLKDGKEDEELNKKWRELDDKYKLRQMMQRADRLSRLGKYSLLMLNIERSGSLASKMNVGTTGEHKILYVRPIPYDVVKAIKVGGDASNANFGKPVLYTLDFTGDMASLIQSGQSTIQQTQLASAFDVHATRCIHIVENPLENDLYGIPLSEKVYNLMEDLLKVAGGTAETYWKIGNRGLQVDLDKEMSLSPDDQAALEEQIEDYDHELRRVLQTRGVKVNPLGSDAPKPADTFDMLIALLSGATGIPRRILLGSEAGQLASEQDRANWAEQIDERRNLFAGPNILMPLIKILQEAGLLDPGNITVKWPSAFIMNPLESSMVMAQKARAIGNISRQTGNQLPMQLTSRKEGRGILELEGDLDPSDILPTIPEPPSGTESNDEPPGETKPTGANLRKEGTDA